MINRLTIQLGLGLGVLQIYLELKELTIEDTPTCINTWDTLCKDLRIYFYLLGYLSNLMYRWLQLFEALGQSFQQFIEVLTNLFLQFHIRDMEHVLVLKFKFDLLFFVMKYFCLILPLCTEPFFMA